MRSGSATRQTIGSAAAVSLDVMDSTLVTGVVGVGGTLAGVAMSEAITTLRSRRRDKRAARRAVRAIVGELITTVSILDKALERQMWWPEGDEPRSDEWTRYRDDLAEELDTESMMRIGFVYESVRSLAATRSSSLSPISRGRMRRLLRDDPHGRSFLSLVWTDDRWPWAATETRETRDLVWTTITEVLRPVQQRVLGEVWQSQQEQTTRPRQAEPQGKSAI